MRPDRERARPDERGAGSESWWEPDEDSVASVHAEAPYIAPWPPSVCTDSTAAPHVDIRELDRRRYWHNRLNAHLGIRRAA